MIDAKRLRKVYLAMLFVAFFLCLHFWIRFWISSLSFSRAICNPVGPFGIFLPQWLIISVSLVIVVSIFFIILKDSNRGFEWPWLFILSGGLGNILERIFFGCIMDYVSILSLPIFNVADVLLTLGTIVLLWRLRPVNKNDLL